ncbi:SMP-30/gluconolactonase/LRE family protein [Duganella sp. CF517]|uniref:SMP-30/gluconolactonase/LRE family protein n=1 Tax=Duganella sp. CF517 TaxID=1881038 RepID=UPI0015A52A1A|nr:SMP-30/gluconolactonase/LRE family protein [Duganella sp. CF517]
MPLPTKGHGLRWDAERQGWWWSQPQSASLYYLGGNAGAPVRRRFPDSVRTLATCASGALLLGFAKKLCALTRPLSVTRGKADEPAATVLCVVDAAEPRTAIGDGRTDRSGRFVFGTRNIGADQRPIGSFYQYSADHGVRRLALPTVVSASAICFSADGRTLYFADAAHGVLHAADYDSELASVGRLRPFAAAAQPRAAVHDALVDQQGCVWIAQGAGGAQGTLARHSPDGTRLCAIALPDPTPASMAFGGAALDTLLLTGARGGFRAASPDGATGRADTPFDDAAPAGPRR